MKGERGKEREKGKGRELERPTTHFTYEQK